MNYSIYRFTLNMHNHRSQTSVSAFSGDTAIRLCVTITDGGNPYYIGDGCTAILNGTKADGTKLHNRCVIENNSVVLYDFTEQTTSCVGVVQCELTLYSSDGDVITSPKFIIVVDEREVGYDDVVKSVNEQTALDAIYKTEATRAEAEEARATSETARAEAETNRSNAETARAEAETDRKKAEIARAEAETLRAEAETLRAEAETLRAEAETLRAEAETLRVSAETSRVGAEEARASAETLRAKAENERVNADVSRTEFYESVSGAVDNIGKRVYNLELANEGNTYAFVTDSTSAYTKHIPSNALPFATIDKVGGVSTGAPVTAVKTVGKNLLPPSALSLDSVAWEKKQSSNGTDQWWYYLGLPNGIYFIDTLYNRNVAMYLYVMRSVNGGDYESGGSVYQSDGTPTSGHFITNKGKDKCPCWIKVDDSTRYAFRLSSGNDLANLSEWQIQRVDGIGDVPSTPYAPYTERVYPIPEAVQALDGYGLGISSRYYNYIDFENKTFVRMVAERDYQDGDANGDAMLTDGAKTIYALAMPETEDISEYLDFDGSIEVEGDGWITCENASKAAVPNTATFQIKL